MTGAGMFGVGETSDYLDFTIIRGRIGKFQGIGVPDANHLRVGPRTWSAHDSTIAQGRPLLQHLTERHVKPIVYEAARRKAWPHRTHPGTRGRRLGRLRPKDRYLPLVTRALPDQ